MTKNSGTRPPQLWWARGDEGVAMITVLLVGALLTLLAMTAANVSTGNLQNAGRDRVAGGALGAAEAGLAEALNHMRNGSLACLSLSPSCTTADPWASAAGQTVSLPDGRTAQVKIEVVTPLKLPNAKVGRFRVTSTGSAGTGPGLRVVRQDVTVKPLDLPLSVYANTIQLNGTPKTFQQSVLSKNCVGGRAKMDFTDAATGKNSIDAAYGVPAAVHSEDVIYTKACPGANGDRIHDGSVCNPLYPYDQDNRGGSIASIPACKSPSGGNPVNPWNTSKFGPGDATAQFGSVDITPLLPALKAMAVTQGTYFTSTTGWTAPDASVYPNAVLYFKVGADAELTIQNELDAYAYSCSSPRTLIIVVDNGGIGTGGVHMNSNANLAGALMIPRGNFQYNGTATWTGPIYANTIDKWNGNSTSQLTSCYLDNMPPGMLEMSTEVYHEVDAAS